MTGSSLLPGAAQPHVKKPYGEATEFIQARIGSPGTPPLGKPVPFEFTLTERATEKDTWKHCSCLPEAFLESIEKNLGHQVGGKAGSGIIGATFPRGARLAGKNIKMVTAVILDFDGKSKRNGAVVEEPLDVQAILAKLPFRGVAHSSYSHRPDFPKFRVIFPLAKQVGVEQHQRLWHWMASLVNYRCDGACKDAGRMFYLPRCTAEAKAAGWPWFRQLHGPILDVSMVPADFQVPAKEASAPAEAKVGDKHARLVKKGSALHRTSVPRREARLLLDEMLRHPLIRWMREAPDAVSRETWRGVAQNLACPVLDHPTLREEAHLAFHELSRGYRAYSFTECERTFLDAVDSLAKTDAPMTFKHMVSCGMPHHLWSKGATSLIDAARRSIAARRVRRH